MTKGISSSLACAFLFALIGCGGGQRPLPAATRQLIEGFKQGDEGNCTSIGFIKAVIHQYKDPSKIFAAYSPQPDGGLRVTTLAGAKLELTAEEIAKAGERASLVLQRQDESVKKQLATAKTLFAVMAKACEADCLADGDSCPKQPEEECTFDTAIEFLDGGVNFAVPPAMLGLEEGVHWHKLYGWVVGRWFRVVKFVRGGHACVAASKGHTFFVGDGWADRYGKPVRFNSKIGSFFAFKSAAAYCLGEGEAEVELEKATPDGKPPAGALEEFSDLE